MARPFVVGSAALAAIVFASFVRADEGQPQTGEPPSEQGTATAPSPEALFKQLDANGDGQLTEDEVDDQHRRLFQRLMRRHDANSNGQLSLAEFTAGLNEAPPEIPSDEPQGPQGNEHLARFLQANPAELFRKLDANGDGKLVLDEMPEQGRPKFGQFFERADVDRDKALTLDEFRKGHQQVRQFLGTPAPGQGQGQGRPGEPGVTLFAALDLDGDGTLSAEEIAAAPQSLKKLDLDGDGALSRRELARGRRAAGPPPARGNGQGQATFNPQRLLERLDKDGDGKLKQDELPPFLRQRFAQIDANGDGFADIDELRRAADAMQRRQRRPDNEAGPKKPKQPETRRDG